MVKLYHAVGEHYLAASSMINVFKKMKSLISVLCLQLIESASEEADERVEPHPLWEYPARAKSQPILLLTLDLTSTIPETPISAEGTVSLTTEGLVNGMALWADWHLTDQSQDVITTGPVSPVVLDQNVNIQYFYLLLSYSFHIWNLTIE